MNYLFKNVQFGYFYHLSFLRVTEGCDKALGMKSGDITDEQLSASSSFDEGSVGPKHARLVASISSCPIRIARRRLCPFARNSSLVASSYKCKYIGTNRGDPRDPENVEL